MGGSDRWDDLNEYPVEDTFVAYADILGFSALVLHDFEDARRRYEEVINFWQEFIPNREQVSISIYSDCIILASKSIEDIVIASNLLWYAALLNNLILRGGISHGKHLEIHREEHGFILSEALVRAVHLEKTIKNPCIVVDPQIQLQDWAWNDGTKNIQHQLVLYNGNRIINPFNVTFFRSAISRIENLREMHPEHALKYNWLLELAEAIRRDEPLSPPI